MNTNDSLLKENRELKAQLQELQDTLDAIRSGEVDTLLIDTEKGKQLYSLSTEETSYRNVIEQLEKGVVICNEHGTIIYGNAFINELFQKANDNVVGRTVPDFFADNTKLSKSEWEGLRDSSKKSSFETEAGKKKLRVRVAPVNLQVIGEPTEEFKGASYCTIIISDVSEYRNLLNEYEQLNKSLETKVEERTQELAQQNEEYEAINEELNAAHQELASAYETLAISEEKHKALYQNAPLAFQSLDENGHFLDVNPKWLELLEYNENEVLGSWFGDFLAGEYVEKFKLNFPKFKARGSISNIVFRMKKKSGKEIFVSFEGCIGYKPDGSFKQTYCTFKDITKEFELSEQIKESEIKYRQLYESNLMPISIFDTETLKFLSVNQAFTEKYGYSREELLKMTIMDIRPESEHEKLLQNVNIEEKGLENKGIYLHQKKNREIMHVEIIRYSLLFEGRDAKLVFSNDVSKLMKSQAELRIAKEKAEESDKLKSAFLANMSHEIRTPMNGILGFADLLNDDSYDEESRKEYRKIIQQNGNNLLRLIDDIIDISKLDSEQLKLSLADCDIIQLLEQIHKTFQQILISKDLTDLSLQLELPHNAKKLIINTDPDRLAQVINNLLTNAIKFSDEGIITLKCEIAGGKLLFSVADNGMGIPPEKQNTIFERFSQVNYNTTNNKGGAGLGLAISKGIANAFGGEISVESELGKGSTFTVEIPYKPVEFIPASEENLKTPAAKDLSNKTILLVDDDPTIRIYFKEVLKQLKVKVIEAENGKIAVECYKDNPDIDLVLMDLKMPEMNGFDSLKAIRELNVYAKVIAQTAYAMPAEREKCMKAGFSDYIVKPIKKEELFKKIQLWI